MKGNTQMTIAWKIEIWNLIDHSFQNIQHLGIFPIKDMQTPPLTFDQPFMDDGECAV